MSANRPERNDETAALSDAGITLTETHLIAYGQRYRLEAIASYGPEDQPRRFLKPILAGASALLCTLLAFSAFDGPSTSAGLVVLGVGVLLLVDAVAWTLMARRSATLELASTTGHRWRISLPDPTLLPVLMDALDRATGGGRRR